MSDLKTFGLGAHLQQTNANNMARLQFLEAENARLQGFLARAMLICGQVRCDGMCERQYCICGKIDTLKAEVAKNERK